MGLLPDLDASKHSYPQHSQNRWTGVEIECPISREKFKQVGILHVDDTNLWELEEDDDILTTAAEGQKSISDWNATLDESGGFLWAEKCGATIHAQVPDGKGGWVYVDQQQQGKKMTVWM